MRKNHIVNAFRAVAVVGLLSVPFTANAQDKARDVLFTQQDVVIEFNLDATGGHGVEAGFASGAIKGTTLTNFRFEGANLNNYVGIADVDGDRIIFHKTGTGVPIDVTAPIAPDDGHLFGFGLGAIPLNFTLQGTYEVVATTGKYAKEFQIGDTFPFKSIATNPNFPPATIPQPPGSRIVPGTEYVEVYRNPKTRQ